MNTKMKTAQPNMKELMSSPRKAMDFFSDMPAEAWEGMQASTAMRVFKEAYENTVSYKDFLKQNHIKYSDIKSFEDFNKLPIMDKDNYVTTYGFDKINSVKAGKDLYSFSLSSGTTDKPTVWPRYYAQEEGYVGIFDMFMTMYWNIDKKKTLAINAYNLGVYASGIAVNVALRPLTQKYKMTMATTGSDLDNIVETVKQLSKHYDQTIIFSYPTFVRSVIDKLIEAKVNIKKLNLKIFIGGEGNTVEWGQYISKLASNNPNDLTTIIDGYGTTDLGLLGVGSSLTNLIRNLANKDKSLREALFGRTDIIPTLFQYVTNNYYIEEIDNELYFTSSSSTPLVRYNLRDRGGIIKFRVMEQILVSHGYDYKKMIREAGVSSKTIWQQPFVYCFGRSSDTVIIGGGNIFPEQVSPALINSKNKNIHSFKLSVKADKQQHQVMYILLELKKDLEYNKKQLHSAIKKYHDIILKHLMKVNSDYAVAFRSDPKYCDPKIEIFEYGTGPFTQDRDRTKPKLVIK